MGRRRGESPGLGRDLVYGALAGVVGAACMTPLRIVARRAGLIDKMVPEVMEETLAHRLGVGRGRPPEQHHLADHLLHLGYGGAQGALYALAARRRTRSTVKPGLVLGAVTWLFNGAVVIPLLDATRPIWRQRPRENLVNLAAHLVFGVVTALAADDLPRQRDHRPTPDWHRRASAVG